MRLALSGIPPKLTLSDRDLAALLSNILDNALEACGRMLPGRARSIELELGWHRDMLLLDCRDTHDGTLGPRQGRYRSVKEDHERHGYGLRIAGGMAARCEGELDVSHTADSFRVFCAVRAGVHDETINKGGEHVPDCNL